MGINIILVVKSDDALVLLYAIIIGPCLCVDFRTLRNSNTVRQCCIYCHSA